MPTSFPQASSAAARCDFAHPFRRRTRSVVSSPAPRHASAWNRQIPEFSYTKSKGLGKKRNMSGPPVAAAADAKVTEDTDVIEPIPQAPAEKTVVCLGKFDAMHRGHRELAVAASAMGAPHLVSFGGMAEVLGWQPKLPITADSDRQRVLSTWSETCNGKPVGERVIPFKDVRQMSPEAFVMFLKENLNVGGIVAGSDYRFGFRASGTSDDLIELGKKHGLDVHIVELLQAEEDVDGQNGKDSQNPDGLLTPQVSSTRVRACLASGDVEQAGRLLGRAHRLVLAMNENIKGDGLTFPVTGCLNQYPAVGSYRGETCDEKVEVVVEVTENSIGPLSIAVYAADDMKKFTCGGQTFEVDLLEKR